MWRRALLLAFLAGGVLPAEPTLAQQIDAGAPEGAERTANRSRGYDSYELPTGAFGPNIAETTTLNGQVDWSAYRIDQADATTADVMAGYRARLLAKGFEEILLDCAGETCGGFDFRFGVAMLPPPRMLMDVRDFAQLSVRRAEPEGFVSVLVSRVQGQIFVQTVTVVPSETSVEVEDAPVVSPETQTAPLPQDERALLAALIETGHVPVDGLEFATGGAALSEGSNEALDMLATLLSRDSELRVAIVGHSDNEGGLDPNIALSQRRARAVMQALIKRGVPKGQVEARGIGYLAPVTSNATPEGRAQNRRVELVLR